jgi:predicted solute-binding protein
VKKKIKKLTFKEAERSDLQYWRNKKPEEKLDALQYLRELYYDLKNESRKGFQRVYRVIKQK